MLELNNSLYTPKGITFSPTYYCPSMCSHCNIPFNRFDLNIKLDIDSSINVLKEAKQIGISSFQIAGGEPTLCEDFIIDLIKSGKKLSFKIHRFPTNCILGGEPDKLNSFFSRLSEAGFMSGFRISYDHFHKFIRPEWTANFIFYADKYFNLDKFIIGCCDIDKNRSVQRVEQLTQLLSSYGLKSSYNDNYLIAGESRIKVVFWAPTRPTWDELPDSSFVFKDIDTNYTEKNNRADAPISRFGCLGPKGTGYFWIDPTGDVRACCGNSNIFSNALIIGNIYSMSLADIYEKALSDPLIRLLADGGPVALALSAGAEDLLKYKYTHQCDLCARLLSDKNVVECIARK